MEESLYPESHGGMGFRDLHLFNKAMIAKQGWRLMTNQSTLCYKVMKAKYFPNCSFIEAAKGSKPSYLWRSIWNSKEVFEKGAIWRIGNGRTVRIFKDNWLPESNNMKVKSVRRNLGPNAKVEELMLPNNGGWNEVLIRREFNQYEAQIILDIPLFQSSPPDQFTWSKTANGYYSVKSGYYSLLTSELEFGPHRLIWKHLWNSGVAPKIKLCVWKLCNNILPAGTVAMQFSRLAGHNRIILEGDALAIIKAINSKEQSLTRFGPLIDDCKERGRQCEEFQASFMKRDGNKLAHSLTKLSKSLSCDMYWKEEYPPCVHQVMMDDAINV